MSRMSILLDHYLRKYSSAIFRKPLWKQVVFMFAFGATMSAIIEAFQCRTGYYNYQIAKKQIENVQEMNKLATGLFSQRDAVMAFTRSAKDLIKKRDAARRSVDLSPKGTNFIITGVDVDLTIGDLQTKMLVYFDKEKFTWLPHPYAEDILTLAIINTQLNRLPGAKVSLR